MCGIFSHCVESLSTGSASRKRYLLDLLCAPATPTVLDEKKQERNKEENAAINCCHHEFDYFEKQTTTRSRINQSQ